MQPQANPVLQAVHNLFIWFNKVSAEDAVITRSDVEQLYTPDAKMILNGEVKCQGIEGNYLHFLDLQSKMKSWHFHLPFEITVVEGDRVAGYYLCDFVANDGAVGLVHDMCFWTVREGKISSLRENVIFEGKEIEVAAFE